MARPHWAPFKGWKCFRFRFGVGFRGGSLCCCCCCCCWLRRRCRYFHDNQIIRVSAGKGSDPCSLAGWLAGSSDKISMDSSHALFISGVCLRFIHYSFIVVSCSTFAELFNCFARLAKTTRPRTLSSRVPRFWQQRSGGILIGRQLRGRQAWFGSPRTAAASATMIE